MDGGGAEFFSLLAGRGLYLKKGGIFGGYGCVLAMVEARFTKAVTGLGFGSAGWRRGVFLNERMLAMAEVNYNAGVASAIRYDVVRNHAAQDAEGKPIYNARVSAPTKSLKDVAKTMSREGSKFRASEIYQMLEHFSSVVTQLVEEGNAVNVGSLFRIRPSIRGTFSGEDDAFVRSKQRIQVRASVGANLRNACSNARVMRIGQMMAAEIVGVVNSVTQKANTLCPAGSLNVSGKRLMYDTQAEDEGVFLTVSGKSYRGKAVAVTPSLVVVAFPDCNIGEGETATLVLKSRAYTAELHETVFEKQLTYEAAPLA